jgi:uncharacterized protein YqjF (DUF2071 family)
LEEADNKHAEAVAATILAVDQAVKEAEARAIKAKKALAEVSQRQTRREASVVKRIDDLSTSFGSEYFLSFRLGFFYSDATCADYDVFGMQQNKLERSTSSMTTKAKTLCLMPLAYWNQTVGTPEMFSRKLDMC